MSVKSFGRFRAFCIGLLVLGVVSATLAFSIHQAKDPKVRHARGFTLVTKETAAPVTGVPQDPKQIGYAVTIRYQKSDGTWKQVRVYYNGVGEIVKKDIGFGIPGEGVFRIDKASHALEFLSAMPPKESTSYVRVTDGHDDPHFLRDDIVQGYKAYVLRFPDQDGYMDLYYAPDLDGHVIRKMYVSSNGVAITEPIQIDLHDPDDRVFGSFPKWVVSYDHFKQKIAAMEDAGNHEAAQAMRRQLDEQLAKQIRDQ